MELFHTGSYPKIGTGIWGNKEYTQKKKISNGDVVFIIKDAVKRFH